MNLIENLKPRAFIISTTSLSISFIAARIFKCLVAKFCLQKAENFCLRHQTAAEILCYFRRSLVNLGFGIIDRSFFAAVIDCCCINRFCRKRTDTHPTCPPFITAWINFSRIHSYHRLCAVITSSDKRARFYPCPGIVIFDFLARLVIFLLSNRLNIGDKKRRLSASTSEPIRCKFVCFVILILLFFDFQIKNPSIFTLRYLHFLPPQQLPPYLP